MRWRRAEIGLVIGGLLSVGLHERAILADRTPPTDDPTPIGTAEGPKGISGRRPPSKPPKLTILDLSHRPHHRRLPRQRFSAMTGYGTSGRREGRSYRCGDREGRSDDPSRYLLLPEAICSLRAPALDGASRSMRLAGSGAHVAPPAKQMMLQRLQHSHLDHQHHGDLDNGPSKNLIGLDEVGGLPQAVADAA